MRQPPFYLPRSSRLCVPAYKGCRREAGLLLSTGSSEPVSCLCGFWGSKGQPLFDAAVRMGVAVSAILSLQRHA